MKVRTNRMCTLSLADPGRGTWRAPLRQRIYDSFMPQTLNFQCSQFIFARDYFQHNRNKAKTCSKLTHTLTVNTFNISMIFHPHPVDKVPKLKSCNRHWLYCKLLNSSYNSVLYNVDDTCINNWIYTFWLIMLFFILYIIKYNITISSY